ncbi:hypothetical protein, partial [Pseudomonas sp. OF001]|uniref:hypothetical protein n=1 Tax=Pseudomonas sp. OF001 TaxID=2772300 RepID=UPI001F244C86
PLAHAAQQTDLDVGALFNAEFVVRHGNTVPERSGVALSFCRRQGIIKRASHPTSEKPENPSDKDKQKYPDWEM